MIADQGRITLPLRMKGGIGTLPAGTGQMPFYTPGSREEGINAVYRDLMAQQTPAPSLPGYMDPQTGPMDVKGSISDAFSGAMDYLSRTRRPQEATGMEAIGVASQEAGARAAQKEQAEQVVLENTPATVAPDTGVMGAAAADTPPADVGVEQTEDMDDTLLDNPVDLVSDEEKEAVDPFLERYKEMTGKNEDDFWKAVTMAGLAIAGGESDDPVMNIAKGALAGMQQFAKDKKERRDSLFLAEIQARKLKAAETPATIQTLEILRDNPELQALYSRTIGKTEKVTDKRAADAQLIEAQKAYNNNNEVAGDLALQRALLLSGTDPDINFDSMKQRMQGSKASAE